MQTKKEVKKSRGIALAQIIILILGTIAIAYAIGSSIKEVSAEEVGPVYKPDSLAQWPTDTTEKRIPTDIPYTVFAGQFCSLSLNGFAADNGLRTTDDIS